MIARGKPAEAGALLGRRWLGLARCGRRGRSPREAMIARETLSPMRCLLPVYAAPRLEGGEDVIMGGGAWTVCSSTSTDQTVN